MRISFKVTTILMVHIVGTIIFIEFAGNGVSGGDNKSNDIADVNTRSNSTELIPDRSNTTTNQRSHSDLIGICSTFREILSSAVAYSCDYSMLYYKGQCEFYSDLLVKNETEAVMKARNDLSFCSDSRVDEYILEHGLTNAPRSPALIPNDGLPIA
ncbi:MAG: hypothetical protein ACRD8W_15965 [Nitrososphaeraceae archaeon]